MSPTSGPDGLPWPSSRYRLLNPEEVILYTDKCYPANHWITYQHGWAGYEYRKAMDIHVSFARLKPEPVQEKEWLNPWD